MFACLYSLSAPMAALITLAEAFTPRFEVVGPLVMLDVSGLSRLIGSPDEIGEQLRRASHAPIRVALAPMQTAAALLAMGRPGLTVVSAGDQAATLAALSVSVLADFDRQRMVAGTSRQRGAATPASAGRADHVSSRAEPPAVSPGTTPARPLAVHAHCGGGWSHPRDTHAATHPRRARRAPVAPVAPVAPGRAPVAPGRAPVAPGRAPVAPGRAPVAPDLHLLRRWGVRTLGAFAALPAGDVYERLGARGVLWQRLARGDDTHPMVPWVPEDPLEGSLDLEWPLEGLEPLSFVLSRLFEPLADRLERADRGAAIVHTHLRLVDKTVHARMLQLPAPLRDPKTLRTLVLLDLETTPPAAAVDVVRVLIEPTPARVVQWSLFERAQASPEQVSTLLARLTALMGEGHVGSPRLLDTWKPGAFEMHPFQIPTAARIVPAALDAPVSAPIAPIAPIAPVAPVAPVSAPSAPVGSTALRRFRLPVPARVRVQEGRPVRVMTDRRGVTGGTVVDAAGPWRTSGEWWNDAPTHQADPACPTPPTSWDRDEWDIALHDGTLYRMYVERDAGQWFIEGAFD